MAMDRRKTHLWLKYNDMTFFVYRANRESPIYIAKFSRIGLQRDFWKIGTVIKGKDNIIIARDKGESNGPSVNQTGVVYIHVPPNVIIYHEMDIHGNTFKMKIFYADQDLRIIDFVAIKRQIYIVSPDRIYQYIANEDKLRKEVQLSDFKENEFKQIGMTKGGVFLFVKRFKGGERLFANDKFETLDGHLHLEGLKVRIRNAGDQNYVVFVQYKGKPSCYYYLTNEYVKKAISLEFVKIEGLSSWYQNVVGMKDRIHFYDGLKHALYIKGSAQGILHMPTSHPIMGIWYQSTYQYLKEDRFLLVKDDLKLADTRRGILELAKIALISPRVICVTERESVENYLKFVVYTRTAKYRFSVKINGQGGAQYINPTFFVIAWCFAMSLFIILISYCCLQKAKMDKLKGKADIILGSMEILEQKDREDSILEPKDDKIYDSDEEEEDEFQNGLNISL